VSRPPSWKVQEQTAQRRRQARYLGQFAAGRTFSYQPRPLDPGDPDAEPPRPRVEHPRFGQAVTVVRAPRQDVQSPSVRVAFVDGTELTVRPSALQRFETDPFTRMPPAPDVPGLPGRSGQALVYPETPPEPSTPQALHRITQEARAEINRLAQAIHRRHFVAAPRAERFSGYAATPSQPRADASAGEISEQFLGSYSDALEACRMLSAGRWEEAGHYAQQALVRQARYRNASKTLEQTRTRLSTGRFFHGELLSIRHHHPCDDPRMHAAFEQWYVRLVLIWAEDGVTLTVANAQQLEGESGIIVGPDGWSDLVRWISDLTEIEDGKRRGRRLDDDRDLIYLWRDDREEFELRRRLHATYPGLPRAFECLRRSMHALLALDRGELPEDRPDIGYHPPERREDAPEDDESISDEELAVVDRW
jgi:hypothetical protein